MARRSKKPQPIGPTLGTLAGLLVAGSMGLPSLQLNSGGTAGPTLFLVWMGVGLIIGALVGTSAELAIRGFYRPPQG